MTAPVLLVLRSFFPLRTQEHLHRHQHQIGCQISLFVTSGCGKRVVYGPKSDCNYFTEISKRLDNRFVKSYPCSNRPVLCEQCQSYYWSYNLDVHYKQLHVGIQCPEQISQEERVFIISSKKMWLIYIYILKIIHILNFTTH